MKKMQKWLLALALVMLIGATIKPAVSYFTTYATAKGSAPLFLGDTITHRETFDEMKKHLVVVNEPDSAADRQLTMFVRARAFAGGLFTLDYSGDGWSDKPFKGQEKDGYFYYTKELAPGEETTPLDISIDIPDDAEIGKDVDFEVAVIYECVPVMYDDDGKTMKAYNDPEVWNQKITIIEQKGGN